MAEVLCRKGWLFRHIEVCYLFGFRDKNGLVENWMLNDSIIKKREVFYMKVNFIAT